MGTAKAKQERKRQNEENGITESESEDESITSGDFSEEDHESMINDLIVASTHLSTIVKQYMSRQRELKENEKQRKMEVDYEEEEELNLMLSASFGWMPFKAQIAKKHAGMFLKNLEGTLKGKVLAKLLGDAVGDGSEQPISRKGTRRQLAIVRFFGVSYLLLLTFIVFLYCVQASDNKVVVNLFVSTLLGFAISAIITSPGASLATVMVSAYAVKTFLKDMRGSRDKAKRKEQLLAIIENQQRIYKHQTHVFHTKSRKENVLDDISTSSESEVEE